MLNESFVSFRKISLALSIPSKYNINEEIRCPYKRVLTMSIRDRVLDFQIENLCYFSSKYLLTNNFNSFFLNAQFSKFLEARYEGLFGNSSYLNITHVFLTSLMFTNDSIAKKISTQYVNDKIISQYIRQFLYLNNFLLSPYFSNLNDSPIRTVCETFSILSPLVILLRSFKIYKNKDHIHDGIVVSKRILNSFALGIFDAFCHVTHWSI